MEQKIYDWLSLFYAGEVSAEEAIQRAQEEANAVFASSQQLIDRPAWLAWTSHADLQKEILGAGSVAEMALRQPGARHLGCRDALPVLYSIVLSFHSYDIRDQTIGSFVGLENYATSFADWRFANTLKVTAAYVLPTLPAELLLGFALALLVDHRHGVLDRLQSLLILPMMLTPVAVGVIWKLMLNPEVGILSYLVRGVGIEPPQWPAIPMALPTLALVDIWQWTP